MRHEDMVEVPSPFFILSLPRFESQIRLRRVKLLDISLGQDTHGFEQGLMIDGGANTEGSQSIQCRTVHFEQVGCFEKFASTGHDEREQHGCSALALERPEFIDLHAYSLS